MTAWTLAEARAQLEAWKAASLALATGQSYAIGSRTLTRANWDEVQKALTKWERLVMQLQSGRGPGVRVLRTVPRDL